MRASDKACPAKGNCLVARLCWFHGVCKRAALNTKREEPVAYSRPSGMTPAPCNDAALFEQWKKEQAHAAS